MDFSSPRFKAIAVSIGFSFWFFVISSALGFFSTALFLVFIISIFFITQVLSTKISSVLNTFGLLNTKLFLGILFVTVISLYGIFFRILRIDLLRMKKQTASYWLEMEQLKETRIKRQY